MDIQKKYSQSMCNTLIDHEYIDRLFTVKLFED